MSYEEIIEDIKSGLTGEAEADIQYLQEKIAEYEAHEERDRIAGACGQMIYELLPEEFKEEFSLLSSTERLGLDTYSAEAAAMIEAGDTEGAGQKLKEGIELLESSDNYREKDGIPFYDFRKPMEEAIFKTRYGFEKKIKLVPEPVVGLYRMYAGLLYEKKEHEEAIALLKKALKWNPYHQKTSVEYADHLRQMGRLGDFRQMLVDTFRYAYLQETLAGCYRRLGWYFSEKSQWEPAAACAILAGRYGENNGYLEQEKKYILESAGDGFVIPEGEDIERIAGEHGVPSRPSKEILNIARSRAEEFRELGNEEAFKYFDDIAQDLTQNHT